MKAHLAILAFCCCVSGNADAQTTDLELWTSRSGHQTKGSLYSVDVDNQTLTLLVPRTIPFDKLTDDSISKAKRLDKPRAESNLPSPSEIKKWPEAKQAAFLFALHDLHDQKLVTEAAIQPYIVLLEMLETVYGLTSAQIANGILAGARPLVENEVKFSYAKALAAILGFNGQLNSSFAELVASYMVLVETGTAQDKAYRQLKALMNRVDEKANK